MSALFFFFNVTAPTECYTYDTLFPYTTLFRSSAPSWREKSPTCSAITAPKGMEISTDGMLVTFAMNQHWRRYSCHQERTSQVRRRPSDRKSTRLNSSH